MSGLSVLMSLYANDRSDYLESALQSLVDQTRPADELVLVEDGAITAELQAVIDRFRPLLNICSVKLDDNRGLAAALNEGLTYCRSEFVARMDSDDICLPRRLEVQLAAFQRDESLDIVGSYAVEIDENGNRGVVRRMPADHESIVDQIWACPLIHPAVVFRKERIVGVGGYSTAHLRSEDYELWFRCAKRGLRFANVPEVLVLYRFNEASHRKQKIRFALERSLTGYRGATAMGATWWKRAGCFVPFLRSLLPAFLQHRVYHSLRRWDPRQQTRVDEEIAR